ncbi:MAG: hypothetical protein HYY16_05190 [Planctomycetes bacterium]|nr:hypothetical protein [Planctomycetota bacterium]
MGFLGSAVLWAVAACAQDGLLERDLDDQASTVGSVTVWARAAGLKGTAAGDFDYPDLFNPGFGVGMEIAQFWSWEPGQTMSYFIGGGFMFYDGDEKKDFVGDTLSPDRLLTGTVLAGVRAQVGSLQEWHMDGYLGAGVILYEEVEADAIISGVPRTGLEMFARSANMAGEGGLRFGYGPLTVGGGVGYAGPPKDGSDLAVEPDPLITYFGEVALNLSF